MIKAGVAKEDEFYTQLEDIEQEVQKYKKYFRNKTVLCNCDDPSLSQFFHYFSYNFNELKLKKLITTCYRSKQMTLFSKNDSERALCLEINKVRSRVPKLGDIKKRLLAGDGDFRSDECVDILKRADIVVTNPPFSLFREYVGQLIKHKKLFLIIGNQNAITTKEMFPLIKDNKMWYGYFVGSMWFKVPDYYKPRKTRYKRDPSGQKWRSLGTVCWLTNLDTSKRHERLRLYREYEPRHYPKYDNFDAIEVSKVSDIPYDYSGLMGVPITFLNKYNPKHFRIVGIDRYLPKGINGTGSRFKINGVEKYARVVIKNKCPRRATWK